MYHVLGMAVITLCTYIYAQRRRRRLGYPPLKFASKGVPFVVYFLIIAACFLLAGAP